MCGYAPRAVYELRNEITTKLEMTDIGRRKREEEEEEALFANKNEERNEKGHYVSIQVTDERLDYCKCSARVIYTMRV